MMEIFEVQYQYMKHVDNVKTCIIRELQVRITIFLKILRLLKAFGNLLFES